MRLFPYLLAVGLLGPCVPGCQALQPSGFPRELQPVVEAVATTVTEQGVLDTFAAGIEGEVIEPGVEGYAGVIYVAGGKLRGTSGRIYLNADGTATGQPNRPEVVDRVVESILSDTRVRERIIEAVTRPQQPVLVEPAP